MLWGFSFLFPIIDSFLFTVFWVLLPTSLVYCPFECWQIPCNWSPVWYGVFRWVSYWLLVWMFTLNVCLFCVDGFIVGNAIIPVGLLDKPIQRMIFLMVCLEQGCETEFPGGQSFCRFLWFPFNQRSIKALRTRRVESLANQWLKWPRGAEHLPKTSRRFGPQGLEFDTWTPTNVQNTDTLSAEKNRGKGNQPLTLP